MLADLCSSGHPGKVGTLAFIQYTCLFNPHPAIRPTRKGPAGSKPVMTWIGLSGNQPAIHWMLDKTQPSLPNNILHLKAFHPYCKRPECEKNQDSATERSTGTCTLSQGDKGSRLPQLLTAAHGDCRKLSTAVAFHLVLTKIVAMSQVGLSLLSLAESHCTVGSDGKIKPAKVKPTEVYQLVCCNRKASSYVS